MTTQQLTEIAVVLLVALIALGLVGWVGRRRVNESDLYPHRKDGRNDK